MARGPLRNAHLLGARARARRVRELHADPRRVAAWGVIVGTRREVLRVTV